MEIFSKLDFHDQRNKRIKFGLFGTLKIDVRFFLCIISFKYLKEPFWSHIGTRGDIAILADRNYRVEIDDRLTTEIPISQQIPGFNIAMSVFLVQFFIHFSDMDVNIDSLTYW